MARGLAILVKLVQTTFAPETLPQPDKQPLSGAHRASWLQMFFGSESLPFEELPERRRQAPSLLGWLLSSEALPREKSLARPTAQRSLPRTLIASESLPYEPSRPRPAHPRWITWFFASERIDDSAREVD